MQPAKIRFRQRSSNPTICRRYDRLRYVPLKTTHSTRANLTCPHTRTLSGMQANSDHPTSGHSRSTAPVGRSAPFLSKRALSFSSLSCARLFGVSSSRYVPRFMTASASDIQNMLPFYETQHPESLLKSTYQHPFCRLCNPECWLRTR